MRAARVTIYRGPLDYGKGSGPRSPSVDGLRLARGDAGMLADGLIAATHVENPAGAVGSLLVTEVAEHERQFRETLEHCPAGLIVVDENGRLLFHNAPLRELLGSYQKAFVSTRQREYERSHSSPLNPDPFLCTMFNGRVKRCLPNKSKGSSDGWRRSLPPTYHATRA